MNSRNFGMRKRESRVNKNLGAGSLFHSWRHSLRIQTGEAIVGIFLSFRGARLNEKSCYQEKVKKSQSSAPTDLHLAEEQKPLPAWGARLEQLRIEAQKML